MEKYFSIASLLYFVQNWQKEIEELKGKLANVSPASNGGVEKLKENYLQKLNVLEEQVNFNLLCDNMFDSTTISCSENIFCFHRLQSWRRNNMFNLNSQPKGQKVMRQREGCSLRFKVWRLRRCRIVVVSISM